MKFSPKSFSRPAPQVARHGSSRQSPLTVGPLRAYPQFAPTGYRDRKRLGYYGDDPWSSTVVPFGTSTINTYGVAGGTVSRLDVADTSEMFGGTPSTHLSVTAGGSSTYFEPGTSGATITLDAHGQNLMDRFAIVAVKTDAGNTLSGVSLYVGDGTYANNHQWTLEHVGDYGGWSMWAKIAPVASATTGTPNLAAPVRAKLRLTMTANVAIGHIWISPVFVMPPAVPSVVFTVDDGYDEWAWLAAEAHARGVPLSFGIASDYVGTAGFLTEAQIQSIANDYDGLHIFTNHARANGTYTALGLSAYMAAIEHCRDYLIGLGIPAAHASLHQYVGGDYDATLKAALQSAGFLSGRAVYGDMAGEYTRAAPNLPIGLEGAACDSLFHLPCVCNLDNTQNLTIVQGYIESSAIKGTAFIESHRFEAAAGAVTWINGYDASYGVLNLLDWLAGARDNNGWKLLNWYDWYSDRVLP